MLAVGPRMRANEIRIRDRIGKGAVTLPTAQQIRGIQCAGSSPRSPDKPVATATFARGTSAGQPAPRIAANFPPTFSLVRMVTSICAGWVAAADAGGKVQTIPWQAQASAICGKFGRSGGIRTHDPQSPRLMRYQAALRSDRWDGSFNSLAWEPQCVWWGPMRGGLAFRRDWSNMRPHDRVR
jgi:hypothetical protein